jgi:hypothetical protein
MQFETPQFIDRKAKVIGPLTFRGAGYLGSPLILIFFLWFMLGPSNLILFVAVSLLLEGAGIALAFVNIEGKTIPQILISAAIFFIRPKTYVWKRGDTNFDFKQEKYVNPNTNGEGLQKDQLIRKSRVGDLSIKVQTKQ